MTPERWARVQQLYDDALRVAPDARHAFVKAQADGDRQLEDEVLSLLSFAPAAESYLQTSPIAQRTNDYSPGTCVAQYRIEGKLAQGGMGSVYRARDTRLSRTVALKFVRPEILEGAFGARRLLLEARAAAALHHPAIVTVHDIIPFEGQDVIVMEHVEGSTLADILARGPLQPDEALRIGSDVADALRVAHGSGIIHRDLKPSNVMLCRDGQVKLLDFGLAKLEHGGAVAMSAPPTQTGFVCGTVGYMSPEQARGAALDARSDIFALGVVLYEMLTGARPFKSASLGAYIEELLTTACSPPGRLRPELGPRFDSLLARMLAARPQDRFQTMDDALRAMQALRTHTTSARPYRWPWIASLLVILAAVGTALWAIRTGKSADPATPDPPTLVPVPFTTSPGDEQVPCFSPDGQQVAFSWRRPGLDQNDIYIRMLGSNHSRQFTDSPMSDFSPVWSPDGLWIAFLRSTESSGDHTRLLLKAVVGGPEREIAQLVTPWSVTSPSWHPSSRWIAIDHRPAPHLPQVIYAFSLETGEVRQLTSHGSDVMGDTTPAFSPDGRRLAFVRRLSEEVADVWVLDVTEDLRPAGEPRRATNFGLWVGRPAWYGGGRRIVFSGGLMEATSLWTVGVGKVVEPLKPKRLAVGSDGAFSPTVSSRGTLVWSTYRDSSDIYELDLAARPNLPAPAPASPLITSTRVDQEPVHSPDGRRIAFMSQRSPNKEVWICNADGSDPVQLTNLEAGNAGWPRWSPDGSTIAFFWRYAGPTAVYTIRVNGGQPVRVTPPVEVTGPAWSADGRSIYYSTGQKSEMQAWKTPADGGSPVRLSVPSGLAVVGESADGRVLYLLKPETMMISSLWSVEATRGKPKQIVPSITSMNFAIGRTGVWFIPEVEPYAIHYLDFRTERVTKIATVKRRPGWGLSISPDERTLLTTQNSDEGGADLMIAEGLK